MISPDEIRRQALGWWKPLLEHHIEGARFFPKQIERIGKVLPNQIVDRFEALQREIQLLYQHSRNETGKGYQIITSARNYRRTGAQELPDTIVIDTLVDYLHVTKKEADWQRFCHNFDLLVKGISSLRDWALRNPLRLVEPEICWPDILKVCHYFLLTPRPDLYIRQLPIEVHTKFVEENSSLLISLLDFLIPEHIRDSGQKRFAERYFLRYDEPSVRIRTLDPSLALDGIYPDIQLPLSSFERRAWPALRIVITENKMNFLTLPSLSGTMAIWSGGGFQVSYLRNAVWMADKQLYYWGDIDEHGFQILHQIRSYFPHTRSVMMDRRTFGEFDNYIVAGKNNPAIALAHLTADEAELYQMLKSQPGQNRLEQEKILQSYVDEVFKSLDL